MTIGAARKRGSITGSAWPRPSGSTGKHIVAILVRVPIVRRPIRKPQSSFGRLGLDARHFEDRLQRDQCVRAWPNGRRPDTVEHQVRAVIAEARHDSRARADGIRTGACDACRARVTGPHRPAGNYQGRGRVGAGTHFLSTACGGRIFSALGALMCGFAVKHVLLGELSCPEPASL